ncbi:hypothetical protein E2C01_079635 [Portunus trituberculatus]|uniref:Uncharacterized protein n=1 Tax=Portunus trituberculatus TaxID=210409 RepID=A0A5B7IXI9_PORTR|nr:hypothetical protein [Portunus trituberculatus]
MTHTHTKQPSSRCVEACCATHGYNISSPPDLPQPIHATPHTSMVTPLKAPRTDRHHSAIPSMVRPINS